MPINIEEDSAIAVIKEAIENNVYSERLEAISTARHLVLNNYNLFELMASIATKPASSLQQCTLYRH